VPSSASIGRATRNLIAFVLVLCATCAGIHRLLPEPNIDGITPKLEHLRNSAGRYDTLFIGTSRTYHQLIPAEFDRIAGTKTFNAAVDGLFPPEDSYYLERIVETGAHFRYVFLELNALRLRIDDAKRGTERVVYWHDAPQLALLLRETRALLTSATLSPTQKWDILQMGAERLGLFARAQANLGRGTLLRTHLQPVQKLHPPDVSALGQDGDGYLRVDYPALCGAACTSYERTLAARLANPAPTTYGSPATQAALQRLVQSARKLGEPILLIPPTLPPRKFIPSTSELRRLDFADPAQYPELFKPEHRLDAEHLNTAGSVIYTKMLAEEFTRAASQ
jgi:hypothetical protein